MTKGDKVYVVENYLVEERTAALLAGEVGLAVTFEGHADAIRVHVTDSNGVFLEIPATAVCTVPEGHLSDLYEKACPACGLHLCLLARTASERVDVIRLLEPIVNQRTHLTTRTSVGGEVVSNDGELAEIETFRLKGVDNDLPLEHLQVHRENTSYSAEEFQQRFRVETLFEIQITTEIHPLTIREC